MRLSLCRALCQTAGVTVILVVFVTGPSRAQNSPSQDGSKTKFPEPPGRDLFIPFRPVATPTEQARLEQIDNVAQIKLLAEMNKLTVELVRRRSDPARSYADTPKLVHRLQALSKQLHAH